MKRRFCARIGVMIHCLSDMKPVCTNPSRHARVQSPDSVDIVWTCAICAGADLREHPTMLPVLVRDALRHWKMMQVPCDGNPPHVRL